MKVNYINLAGYLSVPKPFTSEARRQTDWAQISNENLKFALDVLSLHNSPFEVDAMNEIERRISAGKWLDLEAPPPPITNMPLWFQKPFFRVFWRQGRAK